MKFCATVHEGVGCISIRSILNVSTTSEQNHNHDFSDNSHYFSKNEHKVRKHSNEADLIVAACLAALTTLLLLCFLYSCCCLTSLAAQVEAAAKICLFSTTGSRRRV
ncbi:hypothetical protein XENORESO_018212 [Xenotaenia resolanae]|uniref:Uncharacterized protein n=1 Tax=Xenotaenia resolanae TaxID=208358 RepID=A0ABV0WXF1_9TELE